MADKLIRALALNDEIRLFMVDTTDLIEKTRKLHDLYPTSAAALGRTMSVATIMGSMLKDEKEKLKIEIRGSGAINYMFVDAYNNGNVRGLVSNPQVFMVNEANGKLDVGGAIGSGSLKVIKETDGQSSFVSQVDLQTGEIGDDFVYYFVQSEQVPSALSVGVLVSEDLSIASAGALLFQVLPFASEESIQKVEEVLSKLAPISSLLLEQSAEEIVMSLFDDVRILDEHDVHYQCTCHRDQMLSALATLPKEDIAVMMKEDHGATLECHYCHSQYPFSEEELGELIA
ncbi:Hsp33 family molecular chaperone HslO [Erysipelothrix urinaevulpis]|uniref:Hsp33 family molecular chaperone HslO n=1 Tax=Erysipelothrix urinaevulpis TaxID=2683717 RepID=UPI00135A59E7|nr:Hsp33 family molecular chaperone HslO [Erysipelothrix urinaevulpis]